MNKRIATAVAAVLLAACLGWAQDAPDASPASDPGVEQTAELRAFLDRLQGHYAQTTDYSATFTQIAELRSTGTREESTGTVKFMKPDRMRWDYQSPEVKHLISDGKTIWFYNPTDKMVYKQPFNALLTSKTPIALLAGTARLTEDFLVGLKEKDSERGTTRIYMIPREKDLQVAEVQLTINDTTLDIIETKVTDAFGNPTTIRFADTRTNQGFSADLFSFTPPEGTDVYSRPQ